MVKKIKKKTVRKTTPKRRIVRETIEEDEPIARGKTVYVNNPVRIKKVKCRSRSGDVVYAFGFLGALVYYLINANTVMDVLLGIFKALLWPAFLVYGLLGSLGM